MPSQYIYTHSFGSNVDLSARVRAYRTEASSYAKEGATAISRFIVDDPEGGLDIRGLQPWTWQETSEASNAKTIYQGYIAEREITRGPFRTGTGRQWTVSVADQNSIIARRLMVGSDSNRPAETDVARVQWLLNTEELGTFLTDDTYVSTSEPVDMDAVDYRNQRCLDILDDCAQASGKNYFVINLDDIGTHGLFYDYSSSTAYASTIRLSNVLSDVDSSTTFAVLNDETKLVRDPHRVYSGVIMPYDSGIYYLRDSSIARAFQDRDTMSPSINVKTSAKAAARARRYLDDAASEDDAVSTAFLVPLDKVNRLKEGMAVNVKFSHLPTYGDTFHTMRVLDRTVTATSEEYYTVALTLTNGPFAPVAPAAPGIVQYKYGADWLSSRVPLDTAPVAGHTLVAFIAVRDWGGAPAVTGWTLIGSASDNQHFNRGAIMYYRVVTADETSPLITWDPDGNGIGDGKTYVLDGGSAGWRSGIAEIVGTYASKVSTQDNVPSSTTISCGGSITPTAATPCIIFGVGSGDPNNSSISPDVNTTELDEQWDGFAPKYWVGYRIIASPSGSYTISGTQSPANHYCGVTAVFVT